MRASNYPPKPFRETRRDVLIDTIETLRLGLIVTSPVVDSFQTVHVPMLVRSVGERLYLESHVGIANPIWREADGRSALIVFQGAHTYVHPGWYDTKKRDGKAVPTWNYISVQARGRLETVRDEDWLRMHVAALSDTMEQGQDEPWSIDDAPDDYIAKMLTGIVGLRLEVEQLDGIWKMSQNHPKANRIGAMEGLEATGNEPDRAVAAIMRELETGRT